MGLIGERGPPLAPSEYRSVATQILELKFWQPASSVVTQLLVLKCCNTASTTEVLPNRSQYWSVTTLLLVLKCFQISSSTEVLPNIFKYWSVTTLPLVLKCCHTVSNTGSVLILKCFLTASISEVLPHCEKIGWSHDSTFMFCHNYVRKLAKLSCQSEIEKERTFSQIMGGSRSGGAQYSVFLIKVIERNDLFNLSDRVIVMYLLTYQVTCLGLYVFIYIFSDFWLLKASLHI